MRDTLALLKTTDFPALRRAALETLQVSLGYLCNQACLHCHVNAGPTRTEMMDLDTVRLIPRVLEARAIRNLDLTGGAPELHEHFRHLVELASVLGVHIIDRCNLTVLCEAGQDDLAAFLAAHSVEVVASLPCYSHDKVDRQRGNGVFDKSIAGLRQLNALGYGDPGSGLLLNLVYNPQGPSLPPDQALLEADYKRHLGEQFAVRFNRLYALANMPIKRFGSTLVSKGQFEPYMRLLRDNHDEANLQHVMCRSMVNVDWQGYLYDCDFNQQLGLTLAGKKRPHLRDLLLAGVADTPILTAAHCFACTAGQGSSCGGAL